MSDPIDAIRDALAKLEAQRSFGPGIRRSAPFASDEEACNSSAKLEFANLARRSGYSNRELAPMLRYAESTLRGWKKRTAYDRFPPEQALIDLRLLVASLERFSALG